MRFISKEPDYYDYFSKIYDPAQDDALVFDRNADFDVNIDMRNDIGQRAIDRIKFLKPYSGFERKHHKRKYTYRVRFFAFASTLYPFFEMYSVSSTYLIAGKSTYIAPKTYYIHNWETFKRHFEKYIDQNHVKYWFYKEKINRIDENFFSPIEILNPDKKMCFASTVYDIGRSDKDGIPFELKAVWNEKTNVFLLKNYDFQNVIAPDQAYQLISMYIADAKNVEKEYLASNGEKIQSHGYNKKYSFRSNHPMKG